MAVRQHAKFNVLDQVPQSLQVGSGIAHADSFKSSQVETPL